MLKTIIYYCQAYRCIVYAQLAQNRWNIDRNLMNVGSISVRQFAFATKSMEITRRHTITNSFYLCIVRNGHFRNVT